MTGFDACIGDRDRLDLGTAKPARVYNLSLYTHSGHSMRTNIVIDDKLMADAIEATGARTKKEAVELGLRTLIRLKRQERIRSLRGTLEWTGDLDEMRRDT
jgi:Arc/MetJ family transcription regulator